MAEALMGEQADRREGLRLLALVASWLGAKGLEDYEPPSEALERALHERAVPDGGRRARVLVLGDLEEVSGHAVPG